MKRVDRSPALGQNPSVRVAIAMLTVVTLLAAGCGSPPRKPSAADSQPTTDAPADPSPSGAADPSAGLTSTAQPGPSSTGAPKPGSCPIFPADNVWHADVSRLPVHPRSAAYVASIGPSRPVHPDFGSGLLDGKPWGIPVTTIRAGQPRVPVSFDVPDESDPGPYPIPRDALVEGGPNGDGDRHVIVYDPAGCRAYEMHDAHPSGGGWRAYSGAVFDLRSNRMRPLSWTSADAAGLSILAGLVRYDEVAAGHVDHAIRMTVQVSQRAYVWPGSHRASSHTDPNLPPMGLRQRLRGRRRERPDDEPDLLRGPAVGRVAGLRLRSSQAAVLALRRVAGLRLRSSQAAVLALRGSQSHSLRRVATRKSCTPSRSGSAGSGPRPAAAARLRLSSAAHAETSSHASSPRRTASSRSRYAETSTSTSPVASTCPPAMSSRIMCIACFQRTWPVRRRDPANRFIWSAAYRPYVSPTSRDRNAPRSASSSSPTGVSSSTSDVHRHSRTVGFDCRARTQKRSSSHEKRSDSCLGGFSKRQNMGVGGQNTPRRSTSDAGSSSPYAREPTTQEYTVCWRTSSWSCTAGVCFCPPPHRHAGDSHHGSSLGSRW